MKVRCLIVDDEPLAIRLIQNHIAKIESLEVVATSGSALKAFEVLNTQTIDLVFLDIKMPTISGIDFLKTLKHPPKAILTTAYRNYALESYELDVIDYLLKPITFDRFFQAIERYFRASANPPVAPVAALPALDQDASLIIKSGNKHHKIAINSIRYIESLKDYIRIHLEKGTIMSKYKISDIEKELPATLFLRVHRSFIINTNKITAFTSHDIEIDEMEIPIGISYKSKVLEAINSK